MKKSYLAILKIILHFEGFDFYDGVACREIAKLLNDMSVYDITVASVASHLGNMDKLGLAKKIKKWNGKYFWAYGRQNQCTVNYWAITEQGKEYVLESKSS